MKKYRLIAFTCSLLSVSSANAVEFNLNVLDKSMRDSVDPSLFKEKASIAPGHYFLAVSVNNTEISSGQDINWTKVTGEIKPCITSALTDQFGLKKEVRATLAQQDECVDFSTRPEIILALDQANQRLNITVPQAWLEWHSANWAPPATWNPGVAGFLLDYNLFASAWRPQDGSDSENINTYGTMGANLGAWRLRSDYQYNQTHSETGSTQHQGSISRTYLFRPLPLLGAKMTLGETDFNSNIFDGFAYTGASLISDDRMLPWELRGYAPQVSGVAETNATVTVSHSGRVIYQTKVPPGPFLITDLNQSVQGTLDVQVTEENGRVNTFQVSAASTPFLTRQGQVRYKIASGRARPDISHHVTSESFLSGEASWGMLSNTSLYGGAFVAGDDYHSLALGLGQNMLWFGALSFDTTWASSTFDDGHEEKGYSYRLNYSKRFEATDSMLSLAAYRFSDRTFHSYANFLDHRYDNSTTDEKHTISVSASQQIQPLNMNLSVYMLRQTWWNDAPSTTASITAGFNFNLAAWKNISLTTSFNTTHYDDEDSDTDKQVYISISIPFEDSRRLSYDMRDGDTTSQRVSWYDSSDPHNNWGISASAESEQPNHGAMFSGNYRHISPTNELNLSGTYAPQEYTSASASLSGSFTATAHGAAFHRRSMGNEPRLMVSTDGVADIPIQGSDNITNRFGYAVVPTLSSYQPSTVMVNMNELPDGVTVMENTVRSTWTEGAIGYQSMASRAGLDVNAIIRTKDGQFPPLGAVVRTQDGISEIGMVSEEGHVWLSGIKNAQSLIVQWENRKCTITLPDNLETITQRLMLPCH